MVTSATPADDGKPKKKKKKPVKNGRKRKTTRGRIKRAILKPEPEEQIDRNPNGTFAPGHTPAKIKKLTREQRAEKDSELSMSVLRKKTRSGDLQAAKCLAVLTTSKPTKPTMSEDEGQRQARMIRLALAKMRETVPAEPTQEQRVRAEHFGDKQALRACDAFDDYVTTLEEEFNYENEDGETKDEIIKRIKKEYENNSESEEKERE